MKKNLLLVVLLVLIHSISFSQSPDKATLFNKKGKAVFRILETSWDRNDTIACIFEFSRIKKNYLCLSIGGNYKNGKIIPSLGAEYTFKLDKEGRIHSVPLKGKKEVQVRRDTLYLGTEYSVMQNLEDIPQKDLLYLSLFKEYFDCEVKDVTKQVFVQDMVDSIPARYVRHAKVKGDQLTMTTFISMDKEEVQNYLYTKMLQREGEKIRDILKAEEMAYHNIEIHQLAEARRLNANEPFVFYELRYLHKMNLSSATPMFWKMDILRIR